MKAALLILGFISYSVWLFLINDLSWLGWLFMLEIGVLILLRKSLSAVLRFLGKNCSFVVFVVLCNFLFSGWSQALLFGSRLGLAIGATYILSCLLSVETFAGGIATLCMPLKLFRVDIAELALSVTVALTFIPLLAREAKQLHDSLKLKGCGWRALFRQPQVYVVGLVGRVFDRAEASADALRLKGYE